VTPTCGSSVADAPLRPVAQTAYYCCLLRANDAARPAPVCGDHLAPRFIDARIRRDLAPLSIFKRPAASNVARHRLVDDLVRDALAQDPSRRIFIIGAGFDTRAFRLTGGRWWEFDDPELCRLKELQLPAASAPNPLTRIPVSFGTESLADHLAPIAGPDAALVIVEGVSMYLSDPELTALATRLRAVLPRATLICDLMTPAFSRRFSGDVRRELARLGAVFATRTGHPRELIEGAGYRAIQRLSIVGRAREAGTVRIPGWLFNTLLRELRDGYAIWVFEPTR
jgi:methyltransferase (TIGR00027 family)